MMPDGKQTQVLFTGDTVGHALRNHLHSMPDYAMCYQYKTRTNSRRMVSGLQASVINAGDDSRKTLS